MALPLYKLKDEREREDLDGKFRGNSGLVFNKYFNLWKIDGEDKKWSIEAGSKARWIQTVSSRPAGSSDLLSEVIMRLLNLTEFTAGSYRCYKTMWRFVTGLGLNHPIENGMAWHHTLGVPYLPGSSVKGLVRAWVEQWLDRSPKKDIDRIFGPRKFDTSDDGSPAEGVGSVIFFDAIPVAPVRVTPDVMTPHYQIYYSKGEIPSDWLDPNPIPFLTVDEEQVFLFAVAPRKKDEAENRSDLEMVLQWMEEALENIGAGAKTATGYGRFMRCEQTENRFKSAMLQRKEEKAKQVSSIPANLAGPIAEEMIKEQYDTDPEEFLQSIKTKWLIKMQGDEISTTDQQTIAKLLKNWYHVHREGQWEKPNKKNAPIIEAIRKSLGKEAP